MTKDQETQITEIVSIISKIANIEPEEVVNKMNYWEEHNDSKSIETLGKALNSLINNDSKVEESKNEIINLFQTSSKESEIFKQGGKLNFLVGKFQKGGEMTRKEAREKSKITKGFNRAQFQTAYINAKTALKRENPELTNKDAKQMALEMVSRDDRKPIKMEEPKRNYFEKYEQNTSKQLLKAEPKPLISKKELDTRRSDNLHSSGQYEDSMEFRKAFRDARIRGLKTFKWRGKLYTTELEKPKPTSISKPTLKSATKPVSVKKEVPAKPVRQETPVVTKKQTKENLIEEKPIEEPIKITNDEGIVQSMESLAPEIAPEEIFEEPNFWRDSNFGKFLSDLWDSYKEAIRNGAFPRSYKRGGKTMNNSDKRRKLTKAEPIDKELAPIDPEFYQYYPMFKDLRFWARDRDYGPDGSEMTVEDLAPTRETLPVNMEASGEYNDHPDWVERIPSASRYIETTPDGQKDTTIIVGSNSAIPLRTYMYNNDRNWKNANRVFDILGRRALNKNIKQK